MKKSENIFTGAFTRILTQTVHTSLKTVFVQPSRLHFLVITMLFLLKRSSSDFELRGSVPWCWPLFLWDEDTIALEKLFKFIRYCPNPPNFVPLTFKSADSFSSMFLVIGNQSRKKGFLLCAVNLWLKVYLVSFAIQNFLNFY